MPHRRLVLTFAFTIAFAVLATIAFAVPARPLPQLQTISAPAPTVAPYSGPSAELARAREYAAIAAAVKADNDARWYAEVARQAKEREEQAAAAKTKSSAPTVVLDGDRFDRLSSCESGQDPTALSPGGKYRGAFQFSLPTWHAAGMSGDPIDYSYADQKAAAMSWATQSTPSSQWPVCWARSA